VKALAATTEEIDWLRERTGALLASDPRAIKAVDAMGRIRGMVAYENWTPNSVQAHMAVDTPVAWRSLLPAVFEYPFEECGLGVLFGVIPAGNHRSCAMVRRLGFRETYRIRDGWGPGEDLIIFEMRRLEWLAQHGKGSVV
jgi:RimJ/RimL family protein N-acetyltransferase